MAQFTKYTGTITGEVGTLITLLDTVCVTGEGWTKDYTGLNKATFRPAAGNQFYLRVDDNGPGAGGAREVRIRGYEAMTDVDTGTGPFPTVAQMANGLFYRKSNTADNTPRNYIAYCDDRTLILLTDQGATSTYTGLYFGDFYSYVAGDGYRTVLISQYSENSPGSTHFAGLCALSTTNSGHYIARGYTGLGGSVAVGKHGDGIKGNGNTMLGTVPYLNPEDGGFYISPVWLHDMTTAPVYNIRGVLRGMWEGLHPLGNVTDGDTFGGTGTLSGKDFVIVKSVTNSAASGYIVIETSDTLPTN